MKHQLRVAICIPAGNTVQTLFALDLAKLVAFTGRARPEWMVKPMVCQGSMIPRQRQILADAALKDGADYLLWLDSDMRFPRETLIGLVGRDKAIVAATYTERQPPYRSVAFVRAEDLRDRLYTTPESTGVEPCFAVGFGCILTRRDVLEAMDKPFFAVPWADKPGVFLGEDLYFCGKAAQQGFVTHIDHDLSKQVIHLGQMEYTAAHALRAREQEQEPSA